jgi:hypothetical protein
LPGHGVEGVADQVDQDLLQAGLVDGQLLVVELAVQLQMAGLMRLPSTCRAASTAFASWPGRCRRRAGRTSAGWR